MLRVADRFQDESDAGDFGPAAAPRATLHVPPAPIAQGRYGEGRAVNWPSVAAVVLLHAVLIGAILQARQSYVRHKETAMVVVNLTPPPPPPAQEAPPPPPAQPEIVTPPPIVQTPVPPKAQVATAPIPSPITAPVAIAAPVAPPSPAPVRPPSTVQGGDLSAQMVSGKPPRYPIESRRKREQGTVVLALVVGLDGRVSSITVARSSGFPRLDDAARDAVRNWRWSPIIRDGQPVMVKGVVDIPFVLQG